MKKRIVIITAALILLISAGGYWWTKVRFVESTNNAYVEADISHVSVKVPGYVLQSLVDDNQHVEKGQLLAVLDSRQLETKLAQADAALASAQANRQTLSAKVELQQALIKQAQAAVAASWAEQTVAQQHLSRAQKLKLSNYSSQENVDQLLANFNSANAHLDEANALVVAKQTELSVLKAQSAEAQAEVSLAQAELAYAQLQLQDTQVTAPFAGVIGKRGAQVGQYVQPGQALFSIVPDGKVWITANFKETQVQYLRVGQTVKIQLDAFPGSEYLGEIDSFSPASGAKFSLLPAENATGNFTKVVQRVPVRIRLLKGTERDPQDMPIIPGLSALIDVNTEQAVMLAKQQAKQRSEHLSLALKSANQSTQQISAIAASAEPSVVAEHNIYQRGSVRSWIAVFGGLIGAFMAILDIQITNASMKEIQGSLGATLEEASWIATAYLVAEMIAIPLSGWLSQGLSTRRYLLWTSAAFIVASLLCSFSWDLASMISFRAMQGFFGGALIPLAFRLILELLPAEKRAMGMALFGVTATFAPSIGPTLGGWLTEQYSWHYLFYINLPPGILVMAMLSYGLERRPIIWQKLKHADYSGIITMALGMGCLEVVLEEGNRKDWFESDLIANLALIAAVNLCLFVWIELKKKQPLVNIRLLAQRDFAISSMAYFILGMALFGAIFLIPLYLSLVHDYTPLDIGKVIMWMGFPQLLVLPLVPKLMQKIDGRYLAAFGFLLFSVSYYMNSHMSADFAGPQMIASQIVRALGQPFILVPIGILATMHLKPEQNASASTVLNVMRNLGGAFGIALVATLTDTLSRSHLAHLKESLPAVSVIGQNYLQQAQGLYLAAGSDPISAASQAQALLYQTLLKDAQIQAFNDVFLFMSGALLIALLAVLSIRKPSQQEATAEEGSVSH